MRTKRTSAKAVTLFIAIITAVLFVPYLAAAGQLQPSAPPTAGTMHSLEDIYDVVKAFKKTPAEVCSGTTFLGLRADGTIGEQTGIKDCSPPVTTTVPSGVTTTTTVPSGQRFVDNSDGTVTDTRTGLVWLQNANPCSYQTWYNAVTYCSSLASDQAGLTDGSTAGQWRLPSIQELEGIGTDPPATWEAGYPSVPWTMPGAPFFNSVQIYPYWSGTSYASDPDYARDVRMGIGYVDYHSKSSYGMFSVWPVRSGN